MLPLANVRKQQHHDVRQHAGLGHGQHDDHDMNLEDMLPLRQAFNVDQDDAMLEDDNNQLREQVMSPREHGQHQRLNAVQDRPHAFAQGPANVVAEHQRQETENTMMEGIFSAREIFSNRSYNNFSNHRNWK